MNQQEMIRAIARRVRAAGGRALLVGGCVRDALLGRESADIDCEVHGVSPDTLRALLGAFGEIDESGRAYGIYTIRGAGIDIALPRTETRTGPGHKDFAVTVNPQLSPAQAVLRRDFTVNAIMRDALTGEYVDPLGGMEDLARGVLRAVPGDGFEEDPLRVLRGAQFAARFHLTPDGETLLKMRRMPTDRLSAARVYAEMNKALLTAQEPDVFFRVLRDANALEPWFAELAALCGVQQNPLHHPEGDAFEHTLLTLRAAAKVRSKSSDPLHFMLSALTHDLGKAASARQDEQGNWHAAGHAETGVPLCGMLLARLGAPRAAIRYAQDMCRLHMRVHVGYYTQADAAWMNLLFDESVCAKDLAWLAVCDTRGTGKPRENADREEAFVMDRLASYERIVSGPMPDAQMLMAAGVSPGPGMKAALDEARRRVLSGEAPEKACAQAAGACRKMQA
ncbi:MAG: tRNA nucleotidyltransferase [Clostridia bacterium]|nr:tRNA nucleotidyltransferase [Clostridia bacterium]